MAPSPVRELRTALLWEDTQLPTADDSDYGARTLPISALLKGENMAFGVREGLPTVIYIAPPADVEKLVKFEETAFASEQLGLMGTFFNALRIDGSLILSETVRKDLGLNAGPVVLLFDSDGKEVGKLKGWKITSKSVLRKVTGLVKTVLKVDPKKVMREEAKLLNELDKCHWAVEDLKFDIKEIEKRKGKSAKRQLAKKQAELTKAEAALAKIKVKEEAYIKGLINKAAGRADDN